MEIHSILARLNQIRPVRLDNSCYERIQEWQDWWKGFHKPFHEFQELAGDRKKTRKLYSMGMAKKVCEDWAAILLNEKTEIVVADAVSNAFLQGEDGTGGVLGENRFWQQGNALVEKAFWSGTGAFVLRLEQGRVHPDGQVLKGKGRIGIACLHALQIIPLTLCRGKVTEAAFVSSETRQGKEYVYLETHLLEDATGRYVIHNEYFRKENGGMVPEPLPQGVAEWFHTGSEVPWFALFGPNIVPVHFGNGLGQSVFAGAVDTLMGVDLAYNNLCRDFKLGGKKVFYDQSLLRVSETTGDMVAPDDVAQQLFVQLGDNPGDSGRPVYEFNPSLRVEENVKGIQAQLDYLSFQCGLGSQYYKFDSGKIMTATQYTGDRQDLRQNANKHYIVIEETLKALVRGILTIGRDILGQPVNPDAPVTIRFEDSYIIDKESERERDRQDVRDGFMQRWEYRKKWYGEDEAAARRMCGETPNDNALLGFETNGQPSGGKA